LLIVFILLVLGLAVKGAIFAFSYTGKYFAEPVSASCPDTDNHNIEI